MDVSKMHALGWQHQVNLETGIQLTYDWFLKNIDQIKEVRM
jgi:GDP-L-fucose synthase